MRMMERERERGRKLDREKRGKCGKQQEGEREKDVKYCRIGDIDSNNCLKKDERESTPSNSI